MPRYMIELPHQDEFHTCSRALAAIEQGGSHFVTHAEWGCEQGVHVGWLVVELASMAEALQLVPPSLRTLARVIELHRITREDILTRIAAHEGLELAEPEPEPAPEPPQRRLRSVQAERRAS